MAYEGGAFDLLAKPFDVNKAVAGCVTAQPSERAAEAAPAMQMSELLGEAPSMQQVFRAIGRLSH